MEKFSKWLVKNKPLLVFVLFVAAFSIYAQIKYDKPPVAGRGETVRIVAGKESSDEVPVATTKEVDDEFSKVLNNKDIHGYNQLFSTGKMFKVAKGTKALVIDRTINMSQVRILEGPNEGRSGWVPIEFAYKEEFYQSAQSSAM